MQIFLNNLEFGNCYVNKFTDNPIKKTNQYFVNLYVLGAMTTILFVYDDLNRDFGYIYNEKNVLLKRRDSVNSMQ